MRAIVVAADGELQYDEVPTPKLRPGEVLVDVMATAVNRADLLQRQGRYSAPEGESAILGLEAAGVVREVPADVSGVRIGDKVCALLSGGGYAEQVAVPAALLLPIPDGWSFAQAAAWPEAGFTAFSNLFLDAHLRAGERLLVHGGASGVGMAAIRLARLAEARVFVTVGTREKAEACLEWGADLAVVYRDQDFEEAVRAHTRGDGVDVILDMVGAPYFDRNFSLLESGGRMAFIAALGGSEVRFDVRALMGKRAALMGSTLRARPLSEKVAIKDAFLQRFGQAFAEGRLAPHLHATMPIERAAAAHEILRDNANIGKVALQVDAA